jgi:hypothetical protein
MNLYEIFLASLVVYFLLKAASHLVIATRHGLPGQEPPSYGPPRGASGDGYGAAAGDGGRDYATGRGHDGRRYYAYDPYDPGSYSGGGNGQRTPTGWQGPSPRERSRRTQRAIRQEGCEIEDVAWEDVSVSDDNDGNNDNGI